MNETKFTPGPWSLVDESASTCRIYPPDPSKPSLALVYDACQGQENIQANAVLIAAAPEMFEALKAAEKVEAALILQWADFWDVAPQGLIDALMEAQTLRNAAIAKAVQP